MTKLYSIIQIDTKPEYREAFLRAARELIDRLQDELGRLEHAIHASPTTPCQLIVTIRWHDKEAMAAHFASRHLQDYLKETAPYVAQPSVYRTFTIETEHTLL
ncbi:antibiotic biosynthesis monooxygenase [Breoghania sp. JC706]|uniref:putative quinol monooxygenase n=1 Tax=Breoghania sp. JC706 TaxID=3117732 RepID=UPI0030097161